MTDSSLPAGSRLWRWIRTIVALALVGFLVSRAGLGDLASVRESIRPTYLLMAFALVPVSIAVRVYNHSLLLNRGERVISLGDMLRLTLVGVGINLFVPTGLADLAKAHYGYRVHGNPERMVISSVLDKVTSLTAVSLLGLAGSLIAGEPAMGLIAGVVFVGTLVPFLLPRLMPWRWVVRVLAPRAEIAEERLAAAATASWGLLIAVWAISLGAWMLTFTIVYLCCLGFGADVGPAYVFALAPLATLARLVPISAGGIGLGEVTLVALLVRAGVSQQVAAQAALAQMALLLLIPGTVGLVLLARGRNEN